MNPWGLYQTHGNVWEWTEDRWHDDYKGAPDDGVAWELGGGTRRVVRGGSWSNFARSVRSAYRDDSGPDYRNDFLGFRCARVQVTGQERAEPIEPGQPVAERKGAMDRSGGADSQGRVGSPVPTRNIAQTRDTAGNAQRESTTRRTIIEGGNAVLHLPPGRDFELRSDMGRLQLHRYSQPEWASAMGRDQFGLWAEFELEGKQGIVSQRMRWIPPGQFMMGSPEEEPGRYDDEGPQHSVIISKGYWLFDTPVTQLLWLAVMVEDKNPSEFQSPRRPVENVSWEEAQAFMLALNGRVDGLNLSLPSEAQWEYACRAGTEAATYNGPMEIVGERNAPVLDEIAWYGGNSGVKYDLENGHDSSDWSEKQYDHTKAGTREVAMKRTNAWGLYDMLGNVWEWTQDHWHENYEGAPADGAAWVAGEGEETRRVVRGGSWGYSAGGVRSAYRNYYEPDYRSRGLGFRCARVQEQVAEPIEPGLPGAERKGAMDRSGGAVEA